MTKDEIIRSVINKADAPKNTDETELRNFFADAFIEALRAEELHGPAVSLHEAYAIMLEEMDEFWDHVKMKQADRNPAEIRAELVQIAAMASKAAQVLNHEA